jgi:hypothetical protein
MPRKHLEFNAATHKHKKVKAGNTLHFAGSGDADTKPSVAVVCWTMADYTPLQRHRFPVPAANVTFSAKKFTFTVGITHAELVTGYHHFAIAVTDKDTVLDQVTFRVVGKRGEIKGPSKVAAVLQFTPLANPNDVNPNADLTVTGTVTNSPGDMTVYVTLYQLGSFKLLPITTVEHIIGAGTTFSATILEHHLEPDHGYTLVATANVEHTPDAMGIYTDS